MKWIVGNISESRWKLIQGCLVSRDRSKEPFPNFSISREKKPSQVVPGTDTPANWIFWTSWRMGSPKRQGRINQDVDQKQPTAHSPAVQLLSPYYHFQMNKKLLLLISLFCLFLIKLCVLTMFTRMWQNTDFEFWQRINKVSACWYLVLEIPTHAYKLWEYSV